ncbi:hypothetical protein [Mucilaginibacter celer]|uniref:Uncharacterized protein n=1 Tax=Mucilaginibacter celer TaxID=2305508 RepID=A0A494VQY2_9SPHI|nr:hypothetical protein [Mucilaginibacter celer]AYL98006.1 hypothetical protein HYN43_023145 [Mucilaginibacter celer]
MKKTILPVILFFALTLNSYAQDKKVAVVTFYAVKQIDVGGFGNAAQLAVKLADDPNFNVAPMLTNFHDQFFNDYAKSFPFQLLPEDQIINNDAYKAYVPVGEEATSGVLKDTHNLPYNGYKIVLPLMGHANEKNLLGIFNQADGVMKVYINFSLSQIGFGGMGVVKVTAFANIALFNKDGEKVFSIKEDARSKSSSPLIGGVPVMTPEKILPMCESALTELMNDLQKDMPKIIKKANAKL